MIQNEDEMYDIMYPYFEKYFNFRKQWYYLYWFVFNILKQSTAIIILYFKFIINIELKNFASLMIFYLRYI